MHFCSPVSGHSLMLIKLGLVVDSFLLIIDDHSYFPAKLLHISIFRHICSMPQAYISQQFYLFSYAGIAIYVISSRSLIFMRDVSHAISCDISRRITEGPFDTPLARRAPLRIRWCWSTAKPLISRAASQRRVALAAAQLATFVTTQF